MHLKVIACEVLAREFFYCAARAVNTVELFLFTQGLHDNATLCRTELQAQIDAVDPERFSAVVLGYGLCNNSLVGLRAGRVKMVVPRAHDCITLFFGSKERYAEHFARHPGTYYYTSGWLEYPSRGGRRVSYEQKSGLAKRMAFQELVEKYGQENAQFLWESMTRWEVRYTHGMLIQFPFTRHLGLEERVRRICQEKGWEYLEAEGDLSLIQDALDGRWDPARFLVLEPGEAIAAAYDAEILRKSRTE